MCQSIIFIILYMQDLIEAVKNNDLKTVENILQKEEEPSTISIVDARDSDEVYTCTGNPISYYNFTLLTAWMDSPDVGFRPR